MKIRKISYIETKSDYFVDFKALQIKILNYDNKKFGLTKDNNGKLKKAYKNYTLISKILEKVIISNNLVFEMSFQSEDVRNLDCDLIDMANSLFDNQKLTEKRKCLLDYFRIQNLS